MMNVFGGLKTVVMSAILLGSTMAAAQTVHGVLRVVKGDVQIKSAKTGQLVRARIGEKVFPKDVVLTGKDARAKVVMVDNNEINISPESQIEIQRYDYDPSQGKKEVLLNVIYGKVRSKVEQKYDGKTSHFQVKTPAAVAGVRGTDFVTSFDRGTKASQVVTFHGRVEFGLPGPNGTIANPVSVTPGTMSTSAPGQPPAPPTAVPKDQLNSMDQQTAAETPKADAKPEGKQDNNNSVKNDDQKEDGKKNDGGKSDGAKADGAGPNGANPDGAKTDSQASSDQKGPDQGGGRAPASTDSAPPGPAAGGPGAGGPGAGMFRPEDFAGAGGTINMPNIPVSLAPPPFLGAQPNLNNPTPVCTFCNLLIQDKNSKLIIRINN